MRHLILGLLIVLASHQANAVNDKISTEINIALDPPKIQLASKYRSSIVVSDYLVSEKLDGVRAYWDGKQLISRQGNVFWAPRWFINNFPTQALDGELWIARKHFEKVSGIVRQRRINNANWHDVRFMVFDLPRSAANFEQRIAQIKKLINQSDSQYLMMIKQFRLNSETELLQRLELVVSQGGEGLMLHRAQAKYRAARSNDLMKLKRYDDAEARVLGHLGGKGKYREMLGALLVENDEGVTFKIGGGFSDFERANPPKIGSIITYKYYGKTNNNVPRFASFLRVRVIP